MEIVKRAIPEQIWNYLFSLRLKFAAMPRFSVVCAPPKDQFPVCITYLEMTEAHFHQHDKIHFVARYSTYRRDINSGCLSIEHAQMRRKTEKITNHDSCAFTSVATENSVFVRAFECVSPKRCTSNTNRSKKPSRNVIF